MDDTTLDWLTERIVDALARDESVGPVALRFLLRQFSASDRADLAEPIGAALAKELDRQTGRGFDDNCEQWLGLFSEAAVVSDDPRLRSAATDLLPRVQARWSTPTVADAMRSVEACLISIDVAEAPTFAADTIDALERVIAGAYRPGEGMAHEVGGAPAVRGGLDDHVASASALLTAHMLTGRLPYAMLADELMQGVLRTAGPERDVPFALDCETARVFCRLGALHRDEEYRRTAVLPVGTDYVSEALHVLTALEASARARGVESAAFGLALAEWLNLK